MNSSDGFIRDQIIKKRASVSTATASLRLVTFTTRAGKSYTDVRWSLEDDGLSVLSPDGCHPWLEYLHLPAGLSLHRFPFPTS